MISTSIDPDQTGVFRHRIITDADEIERLGAYDSGPYWHEVEDRLILATTRGVDTGDPRRQTPSN